MITFYLIFTAIIIGMLLSVSISDGAGIGMTCALVLASFFWPVLLALSIPYSIRKYFYDKTPIGKMESELLAKYKIDELGGDFIFVQSNKKHGYYVDMNYKDQRTYIIADTEQELIQLVYNNLLKDELRDQKINDLLQ